MRRSGSSSCMLRPRDSVGSLAGMDSSNSQLQFQQQEQLSVTMISREDLPSFSTERFFMLSEFHLNAHSIRFVSDLQRENSNSDLNTTPEEAPATSLMVEEFQNGTDGFPPFLIFYVLWRPDMTTCESTFTEEHLVPAVEIMQSHAALASSEEEKKRHRDPSLSPTSSTLNNSSIRLSRSASDREEQQQQQQGGEHDSVTSSSVGSTTENRKTRLYLVVERASPFQDEQEDDGTPRDPKERERREEHFEFETRLAERLAKRVASHSQLRSVFQGITIGVANHKRAAPGLDACLNAINFGSKDRRKVSRDAKCHIGLICLTPDDLLGLDRDAETDGAQNVLQTRISTEWNGKGNLKSFAYRAHAMWCKDYGMPITSADFPLKEGGGKRKPVRRLGRLDEELDSFPMDLLLNVGAFLLIAYYVWKGLFAGESPS